jgi:hypothetical protein
MSGACSTHEGDEKFIQNFGWENLNGRDNLKNLGVDGKYYYNGS